MKIAYDHQAFLMQAYGGVSRYFVRLAEELIARDDEVRVFAPIYRNQYLRQLPETNVHGRFFKKLPPKSNRFFRSLNHYFSERAIHQYAPSIIHETYYNQHPVEPHRAARIVTVHDMIHEQFPETFPMRDKTSLYKRAAVERADHIISISHSTKRDLCKIFDVPPEKVSVVHHGFETLPVMNGLTENVVRDRPFLLFVGNRGGYKNFEGMLRAVASRHELLTTFDVVAFGGGTFNEAEKSLIKSLGFRQGTVHQHDGADAILGKLYKHATAFVCPSLYEGFGLPALEAMALECPVVSSNSSSMPEVVGNAGEYFTPSDIDEQAEAICKVAFDSSRRDSLIQLGQARLDQFSWGRCADETKRVYERV